MPLPTPPQDLSGGYIDTTYNVGSDVHKLRFHVAPFNKASIASPYDYPYTPALSGGSPETGVLDTWVNLITKLAVLYPAGTSFTISALHQVVANVSSPVFPIPVHAAIVGSAPTGVSNVQCRSMQVTYNMHSVNGGRFRLVLIGSSDFVGNEGPQTTNPVSGGNQHEQIIFKATDPNSGWVAHDGGKAAGAGRITMTWNRRLRRHYGMA